MSSRDVKLPTLDASTHGTWLTHMELQAAGVNPDVGKLFRFGMDRATALPRLPTRQDVHLATLGGALRYPLNAKGDKAWDTAVGDYYAKLEAFITAEKKIFADCLRSATPTALRTIQQHKNYGAALQAETITLLLPVVEAALTGETQADRLSRLTKLATVKQGDDDFAKFSETQMQMFQRICNDWPNKTIPVDNLCSAVLLQNCNQDTFENLLESLAVEQPVPNVLRRVDLPFLTFLDIFKTYGTEKDSRKRGATGGTAPATRKPGKEASVALTSGRGNARNVHTCQVCTLLGHDNAHSDRSCPVPSQLDAYRQLVSDGLQNRRSPRTNNKRPRQEDPEPRHAHTTNLKANRGGGQGARGTHGRGGRGGGTVTVTHNNTGGDRDGHSGYGNNRGRGDRGGRGGRGGRDGRSGGGGRQYGDRQVHLADGGDGGEGMDNGESDSEYDIEDAERGSLLTIRGGGRCVLSMIHDTPPSVSRWILDSGASDMLTANRDAGTNHEKLSKQIAFKCATTANGKPVYMYAKERCRIPGMPGYAYICPKASTNLLSLGALQAAGWAYHSGGFNNMILVSPEGPSYSLTRDNNNLYAMDIAHPTNLPGEATTLLSTSLTPDQSAHLVVAKQHVSAAQLREVDKVEKLHWDLNHPSDHMLGEALRSNSIRDADDLSPQVVALNRRLRGPCAGCPSGKFREQPAKLSTTPAQTEPGQLVHCDLIPLGRPKSKTSKASLAATAKGSTDDDDAINGDWGYLFVAIDAYSKMGFAFFQSDKSPAACLRSAKALNLQFTRNGYNLQLLSTDPDKPLLKAADLIEAEIKGSKVRHSTPEDHEVNFERGWQTIKGDAGCLVAQLKYNLPRKLMKYVFAHCITRRNFIPCRATTPLTPALIFSGTKASASDMRFGDTYMVRIGLAKRKRENSLIKSELGVVLGLLPRQAGAKLLLANGEIVARGPRAVRPSDVTEPFGWPSQARIGPTSLAKSAKNSQQGAYIHIPQDKPVVLLQSENLPEDVFSEPVSTPIQKQEQKAPKDLSQRVEPQQLQRVEPQQLQRVEPQQLQRVEPQQLQRVEKKKEKPAPHSGPGTSGKVQLTTAPAPPLHQSGRPRRAPGPPPFNPYVNAFQASRTVNRGEDRSALRATQLSRKKAMQTKHAMQLGHPGNPARIRQDAEAQCRTAHAQKLQGTGRNTSSACLWRRYVQDRRPWSLREDVLPADPQRQAPGPLHGWRDLQRNSATGLQADGGGRLRSGPQGHEVPGL